MAATKAAFVSYTTQDVLDYLNDRYGEQQPVVLDESKRSLKILLLIDSVSDFAEFLRETGRSQSNVRQLAVSNSMVVGH